MWALKSCGKRYGPLYALAVPHQLCFTERFIVFRDQRTRRPTRQLPSVRNFLHGRRGAQHVGGVDGQGGRDATLPGSREAVSSLSDDLLRLALMVVRAANQACLLHLVAMQVRCSRSWQSSRFPFRLRQKHFCRVPFSASLT